MAGRAGRRGIDPEGQCVIALDVRDGLADLLQVVDGSPEPIESRSSWATARSPLLIGTGSGHGRRSAGGSSRRSASTRTSSASVSIEAEVREPRDRGWRTRAATRRPAATSRASAATGERGRRWTRGARRPGAGRPSGRALAGRGRARPAGAGPPQAARQPGRRPPGRTRSAVTACSLDVLLPHGAVVRLKSGLIKRVFWATPPLHVPRDLQRGGRPDNRGLKMLSDQLARLPLPELMERERSHGPGGDAGGDRVSSLPVERARRTATTPGARSSG